MAEQNVNNGNIQLIDPNQTISTLPNGAPDYESMFIFASLFVKRRVRSVIVTEGDSTKLLKNEVRDTNINMMGFDKETGKYTTSYTENETNPGTIYEGFGITSINIKTNSSYIPQVTIEFVDIRGAAFFNKGSKSPYQALFDFPPPLFELTVKGYYGKSLRYQLHLKEHSTKFEASTGNFTITARFIARTFAPLADVPFKFIDVLPLLIQETNASVDPKVQKSLLGTDEAVNTLGQSGNWKIPPNNTHELILKLKNLYDTLAQIKQSSEESKDLDKAQERVNDLTENIQLLDKFRNTFREEKQQSATKIFSMPTEPNEGDDPNTIYTNYRRGVRQFNKKIQATATEGVTQTSLPANSDTVNNRLYLAVQASGNDFNEEELIRELNVNYRKRLIDEAKFSISKAKQGLVAQNQLVAYRRDGSNIFAERYVALDITDYYKSLKSELDSAEKAVLNTRERLIRKINNKVIQELGYRPTIYNIFKTICDDVDKFYDILRSTTNTAENHHITYQNAILNSESIVENTKISAFPLYVELTPEGEGCNVMRKERKYPSALSNKLPEPFPEITLIDNFVSAFIRLQKEQLVRDARSQEDERGNNKWIPATPIDSEIVFDTFGRRQSPYLDLEFQYIGEIENIDDKFLNKAIERFYILSQYSFGYSFYRKENNPLIRWGSGKDFSNQDIIESYARGEAYNLANSLTNTNTINLLRRLAEQLKSAESTQLISRFDQLPAYNSVISDPQQPTSKYLNLGNTFDDSARVRLYKNRDENSYTPSEIQSYYGFFIQRGSATLRASVEEGSTNPIDLYVNSATSGFTNSILNFLSGNQPLEFTKENIIYNSDVKDNEDFSTRFINSIEVESTTRGKNGNAVEGVIRRTLERLPSDFEFSRNLRKTKAESKLPEVLGEIISTDKTYKKLLELIDDGEPVVKVNTEQFQAAKAFLLGSNFLKARSFFHTLTTGNDELQLNERFLYPSIVEVPYFSLIYMGGIVRYNKDEAFRTEVDALLKQFILPDEDASRSERERALADYANFQLDRLYIRELVYDVDGFEDDQTKLQNQFDEFASSIQSFERAYRLVIKNAISSEEYISTVVNRTIATTLSDSVFNVIFNFLENIGVIDGNQGALRDAIVTELTTGDSKSDVLDKLFEPYRVVVLNEFSFRIPDLTSGTADYSTLETQEYLPLSQTFGTPELSLVNRTYFQAFFKTLLSALEEQKTEIDNIEKQAEENTDDEDIKGSLYYTFKSISDKWIAGIGGDIFKGFPNNSKDRPALIDHFMFVDRAMNPIGDDCIIDIEPLLNLVQDYDVNVFSVMSTLLSHNGFEFFPLQNFMSFSQNDWKDSFRIREAIDAESAPNFVCMYIGGTASQLDNESSFYDNDGILNFEEPDLVDFVDNDCTEEQRGSIPETNPPNKPYRQVKAFRVRFAEQNQSFFQDIQLDGKEFTETNDSLAILSKIAGDNSNSSPVSKGQNLYNVYENRAYSTRIKMLSNMMIQPTQYFQLENIPMYAGVYMILDVEHNFNSNHGITEFQGTKIIKYPNPIVKDYAVIVGFQSGTAEDISGFQNLDDLRENNPDLYEQAEKTGLLKARATPATYLSKISDNNRKIEEDIHPFVKEEFAQLFKEWEDEGYFMQINSAYRNKQSQSTEVDSNGRPLEKPGLSFHQYGLAIDVSLRQVDANGQPLAKSIYFEDENPYWTGNVTTFDDRIGKYKINATRSIAEIAESRGFRWGGRFANYDAVHFEKTLGYGYVEKVNGVVTKRIPDFSKEPIYNGTVPRYDLLPEKSDDPIYGTNADLARRVAEGKILDKFVILDPLAQQYIDRRFPPK